MPPTVAGHAHAVKVRSDSFCRVGAFTFSAINVSKSKGARCTSSSTRRKEAAAALGEIGDASSRPHLEAAQDDPDPDVRKTVRWALKQLAGANAAHKG